MAASFGNSSLFIKRVGKQRIMTADISNYCCSVLNPTQAMALRLKASLLIGIVRIHSLQWKYLFQDVDKLHARFFNLSNCPLSTCRKKVIPVLPERVLCDTPSNNFLPEVILSPMTSLFNELHSRETFGMDLFETVRKRDSLSSRFSSLGNSFDPGQSFGFSDDIGGFDELLFSSIASENAINDHSVNFHLNIQPIPMKRGKRNRNVLGIVYDKVTELTDEQYEEEHLNARHSAYNKQKMKEQSERLKELKSETYNSLCNCPAKTFPVSPMPESSDNFGGGFDALSSGLSDSRNFFEIGRNIGKNYTSPSGDISMHRWSSPLSRSSLKPHSLIHSSSPNDDIPRRQTPSVSPMHSAKTVDLLNDMIKQSDEHVLFFDQLLPSTSSKSAAIFLFLELLHLSHNNIIKAEQVKPFDRICIKSNSS